MAQNQIDLLRIPVSVRYKEVRGHLQRLHLDACFSTFQVLVYVHKCILMRKSFLAFVKWSNEDLVGTAMQTP